MADAVRQQLVNCCDTTLSPLLQHICSQMQAIEYQAKSTIEYSPPVAQYAYLFGQYTRNEKATSKSPHDSTSTEKRRSLPTNCNHGLISKALHM